MIGGRVKNKETCSLIYGIENVSIKMSQLYLKARQFTQRRMENYFKHARQHLSLTRLYIGGDARA